MSILDRIDQYGVDPRLLVVLVILLLVLVGSGVGSMVFSGPSPPLNGNETTPTPPAPTPTPSPSTPGGDAPTDTDTVAPTDRSPPTSTPDEETRTRTPRDDDDDDDDDEPTSSPGLELGDDGSLMSAQNLAPGGSGQGSLSVHNAAGEDGILTISAVETIDEENGVTDPESDVDNLSEQGELSKHLEVRFLVRDGSRNEEYLVGDENTYVTLENVSSKLPSSEYRLNSGQEATLAADWRLPTSTGNEVQSDGITVDVGLSLESR